jgi:DNA methylase
MDINIEIAVDDVPPHLLEYFEIVPAIKKKNMLGIPWRIAFALQDDGWTLRSDIIWQKPNPVPASVKDRPTLSHEYIFLLSKSKDYYYDWWNISEEAKTNNPISSKEYREEIGRGSGNRESDSFDPESGSRPMGNRPDGRRNRRSVWSIPTACNKDDHFAVMPDEIVDIAIKAGTSERGCCFNCKTPWVRILKSKVENIPDIEPVSRNGTLLTPKDSAIVSYLEQNGGDYRIALQGDKHHKLWTEEQANHGGKVSQFRDKGYAITWWGEGYDAVWEPGCECENRDGMDAWDIPGDPVPSFPTIPCVVLDPFSGSGTTGKVALRMGRSYVGVEMNKKYLDNSRKKLAMVSPFVVSEVSSIEETLNGNEK